MSTVSLALPSSQTLNTLSKVCLTLCLWWCHYMFIADFFCSISQFHMLATSISAVKCHGLAYLLAGWQTTNNIDDIIFFYFFYYNSVKCPNEEWVLDIAQHLLFSFRRCIHIINSSFTTALNVALSQTHNLFPLVVFFCIWSNQIEEWVVAI